MSGPFVTDLPVLPVLKEIIYIIEGICASSIIPETR